MSVLRHGLSLGVGSFFVMSMMGTSPPVTESILIPTGELEPSFSLSVDADQNKLGHLGIYLSTDFEDYYSEVFLVGGDTIDVKVGAGAFVNYHDYIGLQAISIDEGDIVTFALSRTSEQDGFVGAPNSTMVVPPYFELSTVLSETPYGRDAVVDLDWDKLNYDDFYISGESWTCTDTAENVVTEYLSGVNDGEFGTAQIDVAAGINSLELSSPNSTSGGCTVSLRAYGVIRDIPVTLDPALSPTAPSSRFSVSKTATISVSAL